MDIYIVVFDGTTVVGASVKLQGAELLRTEAAKRMATSPTQLDELRRMKVRTWVAPVELDDAAMERRLYDLMRIENHELRDLD